MRTPLPDGLSDISFLPPSLFFERDQVMYPLLLMPHAAQNPAPRRASA